MAAHPIEALYRAHSRALLVHCTHRLGNAAQARDAVQDAFERVMKAYARELIDEAHAAPYLFRTATNICFDILRHQTVWRRIAPEFGASAARADRVEPQHLQRDFARELFSRLGPLTVSVGLMHFVEGMSQQEIAAEVGLSRRSVFNHIKKLERHVLEMDGETSRRVRASRRARAARAVSADDVLDALR
ncbi:MAG: sigma-70 family RNA polymerase sigma factor [Polyangiales bacterium]